MEAIADADHDLDDLNSLSYKQLYSGGKLNTVTNFVQEKDPILVGHTMYFKIKHCISENLITVHTISRIIQYHITQGRKFC